MRSPAASPVPGVELAVRAARTASDGWKQTPLRARLRVVGRARRGIAAAPLELASRVGGSWRGCEAETLVAEVLPLLDAARFLEREAAALLAPRRLGARRRPPWLFGSRVETRREPFGVLLVIGPANYPILLPGVQALQALVAGNSVVVKPGRGGGGAMRALAGALADAGLPEGVMQVLSEDVASATAAIDAGVDKVVLTGHVETGRDVLRRLAERVTPAVVELSGCDAVVVRADADLGLAARAIAFGLGLNGGFTCIAPRRVLAHRDIAARLEERLAEEFRAAPARALAPGVAPRVTELVREAVSCGARLAAGGLPGGDACAPILLADVPPGARVLEADLPAPVASLVVVAGDDEALARIAACPYRLGATIFGREPGATELARRADVGVAVVNDIIVPTADPRVPFGGRGLSGFGVTRGAEGLLEMTRAKCAIIRRGRTRPHLAPGGPDDAPLFEALIRALHGDGALSRVRSLAPRARAARLRARRRGGTR